MSSAKRFWSWLRTNWERVLFGLVGVVLLAASLYLIYLDKVTNAAIVFGLGFLSLIYMNVARFKRFKGLGFEAELWEDTQKEAADLIERLKSVVSIYTREIIKSKVTEGRWGSSPKWQSHWALYDELTDQHNQLGQKIDFTELKTFLDDYFLFDLCRIPTECLHKLLWDERDKVRKMIAQEFGSPIRDSGAYGKRNQQLQETEFVVEDAFDMSKNEGLSERVKSDSSYFATNMENSNGLDTFHPR